MITADSVLAYRMAMQRVSLSKLARTDIAAAATPGLQDGSPRSGLLSLHARVEDVDPNAWEDPSLSQVFFRGSVYLVPRADTAVFTLGASPLDPERAKRARSDADAIVRVIGDATVSQRDIEPLLPGIDRRRLRRASTTGRLAIRWDARDVTMWTTTAPDTDVDEAREELAIRFFRFLGPARVPDLRWWIDASASDAKAVVNRIRHRLTEVDTPHGPMLVASDATHLLDNPPAPPDVVLLPPDDPVFLRRTTSGWLDDDLVRAVWPTAPPPGVVIVEADIVGRWRRQLNTTTIQLFEPQPADVVDTMVELASAFPIESDRKPEVRIEHL